MKKIAVVLMNLGGPSDLKSVKFFLFNLFYDRAILQIPNPFRWILAKIISRNREGDAINIYKKLGGKSPLLDETKAQAKELEISLNKEKNQHFKTFVSMRYWHPFSLETIKNVISFGPDQIILLPLYPQFSTTTSQSSLKDFTEKIKKFSPYLETKTIPCFFFLEGFLSFIEKEVRSEYEKAKSYGVPRILWTAHGLPKRIVEKGDPYQKQVEETVGILESRLSDLKIESIICYQSKVGPLEWIKPYTEDEIVRAGKEGCPLIVVPISFISEHSETLVELDMDYKSLALKEGVPFYGRVSTARTNKMFIDGLSSAIKEGLNNHSRCPKENESFCCLNHLKFCK